MFPLFSQNRRSFFPSDDVIMANIKVVCFFCFVLQNKPFPLWWSKLQFQSKLTLGGYLKFLFFLLWITNFLVWWSVYNNMVATMKSNLLRIRKNMFTIHIDNRQKKEYKDVAFWCRRFHFQFCFIFRMLSIPVIP